MQCERLSRELARQREQLERETQALLERLTQAREEGRSETRKQKDELAHTVNLTYSIYVGVDKSRMELFCCICLHSSIVIHSLGYF